MAKSVRPQLGLRAVLMISACGVAAAVSAPALASGAVQSTWGNITPFWGNITPFAGDVSARWGNITPFAGNATPSWGNITPFAGNAAPSWGNITPFAGDVAAKWGNITPFWGNITPFAGNAAPSWGNITPFWGNITPFAGDVSAKWGNITPFWGNITPFAGDVSAQWGNITPFWGNITPFAGGVSAQWGNITPFWGNITPFAGGVSAQWGNITPFWGNITPFAGNAAPAWGNITPFWGNITPFWGNITPFAGEVSTQWGNITPFWGNITPFAGDVSAQWGNITPFWGNITPFAGGASPSWGNITPFAGDVAASWGNITPFWGNITPFWGNITPFAGNLAPSWGNITPFWGNITPFWGNITPFADEASYRAAGQQVTGLLALQDSLLNAYRIERPDHWMAPAAWSPMLAFAAGAGNNVTVGLLDSAVAGDSSGLYVADYVGGYASSGGSGHGAAVASLLAARFDGYGTVGVAPGARLVSYNPFDETGTTNFADVTSGVVALAAAKASIVNMSMGVTGETLPAEWNGVFSNPAVAAAARSTVYVIAAGNDGVAQGRDVQWNAAVDPTFLVVGSVGLDGRISDFSNTPGSACLTDGNGCSLGALKDRFIVAPGEAVLVDNGDGSIGRRSGTSLATPLVSGAIALLQSRWPWLAQHPRASAAIVLGSARDMGAPGTDEVYGVGLLDIAASQRPLEIGALVSLSPDGRGGTVARRADIGRASALAAAPRWTAPGATATVYEQVGGTVRDFAIPLESRLVNRTTIASRDRFRQFQSYFMARTTGFLMAGRAMGEDRQFRSFVGYGAPVAGTDGLRVTVYAAPRTQLAGYRSTGLPYQTAMRVATEGDRFAFDMGFGDGAVTLGGRAGFGLISDYDVEAGGANPLLGLASGGAYANMGMKLTPTLTASFGATERRLRRDLRGATLGEQLAYGGIDDFRANAQTLGLAWQATGWLNLNASYTRLRERSSLLGVQSFDPSDFRLGSGSQAATLGAEIDFGGGFNLAGAATLGRTRAGRLGVEGISATGAGLRTTAFQVALTKDHLFDTVDRLRVSVAQPMHVEGGTLGYTSLQVVDRQSGALGLTTQRFGVAATRRPYVAEMLYGRALPGNVGEVSLFGRANLRPEADPLTSTSLGAAYMAGARVRFGF